MLPGEFRIQNRVLARYTLKCLVIIYMAACAAALQSVFESAIRLPHFSDNSYIDYFFEFLYINSHLFPDCVMVALQILVLTVGVRILLGEL